MTGDVTCVDECAPTLCGSFNVPQEHLKVHIVLLQIVFIILYIYYLLCYSNAESVEVVITGITV